MVRRMLLIAALLAAWPAAAQDGADSEDYIEVPIEGPIDDVEIDPGDLILFPQPGDRAGCSGGLPYEGMDPQEHPRCRALEGLAPFDSRTVVDPLNVAWHAQTDCVLEVAEELAKQRGEPARDVAAVAVAACRDKRDHYVLAARLLFDVAAEEVIRKRDALLFDDAMLVVMAARR